MGTKRKLTRDAFQHADHVVARHIWNARRRTDRDNDRPRKPAVERVRFTHRERIRAGEDVNDHVADHADTTTTATPMIDDQPIAPSTRGRGMLDQLAELAAAQRQALIDQLAAGIGADRRADERPDVS